MIPLNLVPFECTVIHNALRLFIREEIANIKHDRLENKAIYTRDFTTNNLKTFGNLIMKFQMRNATR